MAQYELFVGLMWNRIGTPTARAISGTVEEYERARDANAKYGRPEIWFYFRDAPARINTLDQAEQRKKVLEFQSSLRDKALVWTYKTPTAFRELFRSHLSMWIRDRKYIQNTSAKETKIAATPENNSSADKLVRINGYKLFYYRHNHKLTFTGLAKSTGLDRNLLRKLEKVKKKKGAMDSSWFALCERKVLLALEEALECQGKLGTGKPDDLLTQYMLFYETYKGSSPTSPRNLDQVPINFRTRAVVFDFDGTLTRPDDHRTTWEKLWVSLGYPVDNCFDLHRRFQRKEFSHQVWCDMTRDAFRKGGMKQDHLERLADDIELVDGVAEVLKQLKSRGIRIYILSGSIKSVIRRVLGDLHLLFEEIHANEIIFDASGAISTILGTPYDFEGKATFIKRIISDLQLEPIDVLFVGNSCNDIFAAQAGVRTLCVNARHTDPDNEAHWTYAIREMNVLTDILRYINQWC